MLPWRPEFKSDQSQNLMQTFPTPDYASLQNLIKIGHLVKKIHLFEIVDG